MTKEEHKQLLNDLKSATTDVDRMGIIVKLEQDYSGVLNERDTAITTQATAIAERDKYAKLNNDLWLSNSSQDLVGQATKVGATDETVKADEVAPKRTFEDLESKF